MKRLQYAYSQLHNAISLLTAVSADVEDVHYGAVMGVVGQLELLREVVNLKDTAENVSEALQIDVAAMLGESAFGLGPRSLLDDYASVRLESVAAAVLSIQSRYLDADDKPLRMIGNAMYEARLWIAAAKHAVNSELNAFPEIYLAA